MKPDIARVLVLAGNELLVLKRMKYGLQFTALPGGHIEQDETPEDAAVRECKEETGVDVKDLQLRIILKTTDYGVQYIYSADFEPVELALQEGSEEERQSQNGQNVYIPSWVDSSHLAMQPILPEPLNDAVLNIMKEGFADSVTTVNEEGVHA